MSAAADSRLREVAEAYRGPLLRFFQRRLRPGEEADDLAQDVFARLARQDLRRVENLQGYIFQVAANVLRDQARRASVRRIVGPIPDDLDPCDEAGFSPERVLQSREAVQLMVDALHELPPKIRMVFSQYHFDGVAQVEIARRFGISTSTVEKYMARVNAHLLRRLRYVL
jgi:RNA polymerase sigma factor (sigma-70 family)